MSSALRSLVEKQGNAKKKSLIETSKRDESVFVSGTLSHQTQNSLLDCHGELLLETKKSDFLRALTVGAAPLLCSSASSA